MLAVRSRPLVVLLALSFPLLAGAIAYIFLKGEHVRWVLDSIETPRAPSVGPLSYRAPPKEWGRWKFGSLTISLPPSLGKKHEIQSAFGGSVVFGDKETGAIVTLPQRSALPWISDLKVATNDGVFPHPRDFILSLYRTDSSDFRFSMNNREVRQLRDRIILRNLVCSASVREVEVYDGPDTRGILLIGGKLHRYQWFSLDGSITGTMLFADSGNNEVLSLSRVVCANLRFSGTAYEGKMGLEKLEAMFQKLDNKNGE